MKEFMFELLETFWIMMRLQFGYSLIIIGGMYKLWWLMIIGFLMVDLTPSFTKKIWLNAQRNFK